MSRIDDFAEPEQRIATPAILPSLELGNVPEPKTLKLTILVLLVIIRNLIRENMMSTVTVKGVTTTTVLATVPENYFIISDCTPASFSFPICSN